MIRADTDDDCIKVFILDDDEIVRRGLTDLLQAHPRMLVVGEASSALDALHRIPVVNADVALLDVRLPDGSGVDVCREICSVAPRTRCLMLTSFDDDEALFPAVIAGASGYLLKEIRGSSLTDAIEQIAAGRSLIDPSLTGRLLRRLQEPGPSASAHPAADKLTPWENEILMLITEGLTNPQIGERLCLAEKIVKHYVSGLLNKLGMQRQPQIAAYGSRLVG